MSNGKITVYNPRVRSKCTGARFLFSDLMKTTVEKLIPYQWRALNDEIPDAEPSYCMRNFKIAAGLESGEHGGRVFQDSDLAKWLEAVAYSLMWRPDAVLEKDGGRGH